MKLTVATVLWVGAFRGRDYSAEWVTKTRRMVQRHLGVDHDFVCLSNTQVPGVDTRRLTDGLPGWWSKLELFKHDLGRVLYLDLDVLVTGDLTPIANFPAQFAAMPPSYTFTGGRPAGGKGVVDRYQTSCMVWSGDMRWLHEHFMRDPDGHMVAYRGDQDFIGDHVKDGETMPPEWFQKLKHRTDGPKGEKLVLSMPWKCKDAARRFQWVSDVWR